MTEEELWQKMIEVEELHNQILANLQMIAKQAYYCKPSWLPLILRKLARREALLSVKQSKNCFR